MANRLGREPLAGEKHEDCTTVKESGWVVVRPERQLVGLLARRASELAQRLEQWLRGSQF
jgi:hypothetical protein